MRIRGEIASVFRCAGICISNRLDREAPPSAFHGAIGSRFSSLMVLLVLFCGARSAPSQENHIAPSLSSEQLTERMAQMDQRRMSALQRYTATRRYVLDNRRFHKHAEMTVRMTYVYPGRKEFEVVSETGSAWVRKWVFRRLMETEREAARDDVRNQVRITPQNYEFRLLGTEAKDGRACYLIEVVPRTRSKYLFQGRAWVDVEDAAIVRIEGTPAKNPSFWTPKIHFVHRYGKFGPFWLPTSNHSETEVRIFGSTEIEIEYFDYQVNQQLPATGQGRENNDSGQVWKRDAGATRVPVAAVAGRQSSCCVFRAVP